MECLFPHLEARGFEIGRCGHVCFESKRSWSSWLTIHEYFYMTVEPEMSILKLESESGMYAKLEADNFEYGF